MNNEFEHQSSSNSFFKKKSKENKPTHLINGAIRAPKVLCIHGVTGQNLGVMPTYNALKLARDEGLDLVQISQNGNQPTCKILDYGKLKYAESKKKKEEEKKLRQNRIELKEIQFRPSTCFNDLEIKAKKTQEFINQGDHVKVSIVFKKKREASHKDFAMDTLDQFLSLLSNFEYLSDISVDGNSSISVTLGKKHLESTKKT